MKRVRVFIRILDMRAYIICIMLSVCSSSLVWADISGWTNLTVVYDPSRDHYSYAPSVITDGVTEHIFVCQNKNDSIIRDSIYYHKRVKGEIVQSLEVLSHGDDGAWDSYHVCDPNVIQGAFVMFGVTYQYALFYTGNNVDESKNNQVGVAFANCLSGPWMRYPYPLIHNVVGAYVWGVGQPTVTSVNGAGDLLIFYTEGQATTSGQVAHLDLSDMANIITYFYKPIPTAGLTDSNGNPDYLNSFDIVFDPTSDHFYLIREQHPYPQTYPTFIGDQLQVASIRGGDIWAGEGTWKVEEALTPSITGFPRNHNAGFKRSFYGTLLNPHIFSVMFSPSCANPPDVSCTWPAVLWTHDLLEIQGRMNHNPVAEAGPDQTIQAGENCSAIVNLNGTGSTDPDGDALTFTWTGDFGTAKGMTSSITLQLGSHPVTLSVDDGNGGTGTDRVKITVVDTTPPNIATLAANPAVLWPPNHKMVDVTVNYNATDNCGQPVCKISSVTSNEPISSSDYTIVDALHVKLRADRLARGNGRIYTITITCRDNSGNWSSQTVKVTAPHDQGK
jgi:hypothetical protein